MFNEFNKFKVLQVFFDNPVPEGGFQLREISRKVKIAPKSVKLYLDQLTKQKLIKVKKHRIHNYPVYYANRDNDNFLLYKKLNTVVMIKESGLLDYLHDLCMPKVIILFGSASLGEDVIDSDIDIFLQCKDEDLDLSKYRKILNRPINLFFESDFSRLSVELRSNLINGIILKGYLDIL